MDEQVTEKLRRLLQLEAGWSENTRLPMAQKIRLGSKLRLFAKDEANLSRFNANKCLSRLSDYVHCTGIRPVPEKLTGYAIYRREQPKASKERLARRYAKYHKVDYETALNRYSEMPQKTITTPFICLKSLSAGNEFCLWIKKT